MTMKCPVCNKLYQIKGISNHIFKVKDHKYFVDIINKDIISYFNKNISCVDLSKKLSVKYGFRISFGYICKQWSMIEGYKERKSLMNSLSLKRQYELKKRKPNKNLTNTGNRYFIVNENIINKVRDLFYTDLTITEISKKVGCGYNTVSRIMKYNFNSEDIHYRGKRISKQRQKKSSSLQKIENRDPYSYKKIIKYFKSDLSIRKICKICKTSSGSIKRVWNEIFKEEDLKKRKIRMKQIQQRKTASSYKLCRFIGSKPERKFYRKLTNRFGRRNVIHHDYEVVFPLEIDISIPSKKIAICWDGKCHRSPIFGEEAYRKTIINDIIRKRNLYKKNWCHIVIEDNGNIKDEDEYRFIDIINYFYQNPSKRFIILK